jgi:PAS domain S-box-containing protein
MKNSTQSTNTTPFKNEVNPMEQGLLSSIINSMEDAIFHIDAKGIIQYWNPASEKLFGYTSSEIIGGNISVLLAETKPIEKEIKAIYKTGKAISSFPTKKKHKNGNTACVALDLTPVRDGENIVKGVTIIARSRSECNHFESSHSQSAGNFQAIIDNAEEGFVLMDTEGYIKAFNSRAKESIIFNSGREAVKVGDNVMDYLEPKRKEYFQKVVTTVLTGKIVRYDRSYTKDGKTIWLTFSVVPVKENDVVTTICITGSDITKRKIAEEKADQSEKRFRAIVENSGDAVAILSSTGHVTYVSPSVKNILGYSDEEAMQTDIFSLIDASDLEVVNQIWKEINNSPGKTFEDLECRLKSKNGSWRWISSTITNMLNDPAVGGVVNNFRDITDKKNAEQAVSVLQRKMDIAIQLMQIGYWEWDVKTNKIEGSDRYYEIIGLPNETPLTILDVQEMTHPNDKEYLKKLIRNITPEKTRYPAEYRMIRGDGEIVYIQANKAVIKDEKGQVIKYVGSIVDVTQKMLAEKTIADNEKRFRRMVENSGDGVTIMSADSKPMYVSPSISMLLGYSEEEALQFDLFSLVHPSDLPMVKYVWEQILAAPGQPHYENICRIRHKNGTWRWFNGTITNMLHDPAIGGVVDNFRDITENREADKKLKSSEERYRHLFYNNPLPMWIYDPRTFGFLEVNNSAIQKYGYTKEEFLQLTIHDIRPESEVAKLNAAMDDVDVKSYDTPWIHYTKTKEQLFVEITRHKVFFESREAMLIVANDVTEKKQAAQMLLKAYTEKTNILESITDGFYTVDRNWMVTSLNRAAEGMLKMRRQDVLGMKLWDLFEPEVLELFHTEYHRAMEQQVPVSFEAYFAPINMWIDVSAYPSEEGLSVYVKDVTERKLADEKIKSAKDRYEMVASVTNDAIYEWDITNQVTYWGEGYSTLFGHPRTEEPMPMSSWLDHLHPDEREQLMATMADAFENKATSLTRELRFECADKTYKTVLDKLGILYNTDQKPVKIIGAMHDITQRKENELAVAELNKQLNVRANELISSNEELERFAYVASHDLQEPLRMVSSFLQLLQKKYAGQLDQTATQYIDFAVDGAERMKRLILDLLEYSRVGTNQDVLTEINLTDVVNQVLKNYDTKITERDAVIRTQLLPTIMANRMQITQLMQNLVGNALKYNTSFVPEIEIGCEEKDDHWRFYVSDNGIGIDKKFFEKVFIIFQRLHNKKQFSGTGIGLAICKKIVERHGGNIWIESASGNGSTFFFTIKK